MSRTQVPSFEFAPYRYAPLSTPSSIRLLSLIPAEINKPQAKICGQPILSCVLESVDLEHAPEYSVLSCTQGNPHIKPDDSYGATQRWPISVNGRLLYITKNVYEALQQMHRSATSENEIDLKRAPYDKTLLIEAAERGRVEEIKQLIAKGASVESQDRFGETALHYAAENGHLEAVKILLESGANKSVLDSSRRTPLSCCIQKKRGQWTQVQKILTFHRTNGVSGGKELPRLPHIWLDAICIDQENVAERNAQAMITSQVNRYASKVSVWLGVADNETSRAAEILGRVSDYNDWQGLEDAERDVVSNIVKRRTWFQKKGMSQEVAFAQSVEMYSGDYAFDWETLSRVVPMREF